MTIDILISTINAGIRNVPDVLLPETDGISYIISWQCTDSKFQNNVPRILSTRKDVTLSRMDKRGLSRNRNNAILHSKADICVIADDDVRYSLSDLQRMEALYETNEDIDVMLQQAYTVDGTPLKNYPPHTFRYNSPPYGYYASSIEISFRRKSVINHPLFDIRFGLGSERTSFGEEEVWLSSLNRRGVNIVYMPYKIVSTTELPKSGKARLHDDKYLFSKGAALYGIYGNTALLRYIKYSVSAFIKERRNPLQMFRKMYEGYKYIRQKTDNE